MILYLSNSCSYSVYNDLFKKGKIKYGYQMQKFNNCMIKGLACYDDVTAISNLPYDNVSADRINYIEDNINYIATKNVVGKLHKVFNLFYLIKESKKIIKREKPKFIFCDAISLSPRFVTRFLCKRYRIPTVGIITDLPGMLSNENVKKFKNIKSMQKFDYYVLLTQQMDSVVNPYNKPSIVVEGLCNVNLPTLSEKNNKKIIMYTGSLWKNDAGIEYLVHGFNEAKLENCELHFYGTGELVEWINEISKINPNIKYMGCVTNDEIVNLQTKATLLVNPRPSIEEFCKYSFPSKTIEYMLSGTPVLMTKLPGVPDEYFNYVYVIEEETAQGISTVLKKIFMTKEEELKQFGIKARNYVHENKNYKIQAKKILDFLNK